MKCKDCIHYAACLEFSKYIDSARDVENGCEHFEAKCPLGTASLNYEAEYNRLREELAKEQMHNGYLRDELQHKERQVMWYDGIKQTIEVIFGREFHDA